MRRAGIRQSDRLKIVRAIGKGTGVTIEADVSGEQLGDYIVSVPSKTVAHAREEVLAAATEAVRILCQSAEAIAGLSGIRRARSTDQA
jgi:hypothetical protein